MAVRPFFLDIDVYGKKDRIRTGTRNKMGDHTINVYQRDKGEITRPIYIRQYSTEDLNEETQEWEHHLHTDVYYQGECILRHVTKY